jgi:hypothetical protein
MSVMCSSITLNVSFMTGLVMVSVGDNEEAVVTFCVFDGRDARCVVALRLAELCICEGSEESDARTETAAFESLGVFGASSAEA